jgi:hypothetical protein
MDKSKKSKTKTKKKKVMSDKEFLKLLKQHKKKKDNFKYNVRKDKTMKKCHNFCKNDYLPEQYKNIPTNLKTIMNKSKIAGIDKKKLEEMDERLCRKDFCNEGCAEGFDFGLLFGKVKENEIKKFKERFSKKLYNGFVDSYSPEEVEMLKKRGALSGCVMPINHIIRIKNAQGYDIFHK